MAASTTWKAFERRIAKRFCGRRRGADYGGRAGGKNDIIAPGWSIECKIWAKPSFAALQQDVLHAEERREKPDDIPLAVMKRKGDLDDNALVAMRLKTFLEYFGGGEKDEA